MDNRNLPTFSYWGVFDVFGFLYQFLNTENRECLLEVKIDFWATLEFVRLENYFIDEYGYITRDQYRVVAERDYDDTYSEWTNPNKKFTVDTFRDICIQRIVNTLSHVGIIMDVQGIDTNFGVTIIKIHCTKSDGDFQNRILTYLEQLAQCNNTILSLPELRRQIWNRIIAKSEVHKVWVVVFSYKDFDDIVDLHYIPKPADTLDIFSIAIPENPTVLFWYYFLITKDLEEFKYNSSNLYFTLNPETANYYEWQEWAIRFYQSTWKVFIDDRLLWELPKGSPEYKFFKALYDKPNYKNSGMTLMEKMEVWHITQLPEEYIKKLKSKIWKVLWEDIMKYIITENKQYMLKT